MLVADYVESIKDVPELLDMLSAPKAAAGDKIVYEEVI
jgi:exosome complex exonuclease DIS3/RRP44